MKPKLYEARERAHRQAEKTERPRKANLPELIRDRHYQVRVAPGHVHFVKKWAESVERLYGVTISVIPNGREHFIDMTCTRYTTDQANGYGNGQERVGSCVLKVVNKEALTTRRILDMLVMAFLISNKPEDINYEDSLIGISDFDYLDAIVNGYHRGLTGKDMPEDIRDIELILKGMPAVEEKRIDEELIKESAEELRAV